MKCLWGPRWEELGGAGWRQLLGPEGACLPQGTRGGSPDCLFWQSSGTHLRTTLFQPRLLLTSESSRELEREMATRAPSPQEPRFPVAEFRKSPGPPPAGWGPPTVERSSKRPRQGGAKAGIWGLDLEYQSPRK